MSSPRETAPEKSTRVMTLDRDALTCSGLRPAVHKACPHTRLTRSRAVTMRQRLHTDHPRVCVDEPARLRVRRGREGSPDSRPGLRR